MEYKIIVTDLSLKNNQFVFFLKVGEKFMISSIDISDALSLSLEEFDNRLTKCLDGKIIKHVFIEDTSERPSHCLTFKKTEEKKFYEDTFKDEFEKELLLLKLS